MISRLIGELLEVGGGRAVILCGGVGYEVLLPDSALHALPPIGGNTNIYTRQIVREDALFLVGFLAEDDRKLFDLLSDVKGCGPKISLQVISDLGAESAFESIATEDAKALAKANGVGPRLAERIILELKDKVRQVGFERKLAGVSTSGKAVVAAEDDLVEALLALGYRRAEAEAAASQVLPNEGDLSERLRIALRGLTK